jgi:hypothetical protein
VGEALVTVAIALRCPNCGHDLPGLDGDRAWACAPCAHAWEVEGTSLAPRPYRAWRLASAPGAVWLPFWRIAYEANVECADARALGAVSDVAASRRAWVRAFRLDGAFLVGDPGQGLTARDASDEALDDRDLPECVGSRIGSREALRLAELFVLAAADRIADVTPVRLVLSLREATLVAVPFLDAGRDLVCAATGARYRRSALPDAGGGPRGHAIRQGP